MRLVLFPALIVLSAIPALAQISTRRTAPPTSSPEPTASLPVTRVSLYKNGVGFFEHTGHVTGDSSVTIDFTSSQLNDVLQSLTAIDLNGGRISGAGYNSTTPLEQQLRTLPISLDGATNIASFYSSIRGARVEVRNGATVISGRLLAVETGSTVGGSRNSADANDSPQKLLITVVSDGGDVHTVPVTTTTSVRLVDASLDASVTRYLKLLDANRSQGLRHLTLQDMGSGARELKVSYISEVPVWKSTYRILFTDAARSAAQTATIQGWSVVDNTTGADWINVHLSLIAGAPQSFIQPLSQPIYAHRPEVPIAQEAQLTPQTFESGYTGSAFGSGITGTVTDASGAVIPNATVVAINPNTGVRETRKTDSNGRFSINLPTGQYRVEISSPGFNTLATTGVNVNGQQMAALTPTLQVGATSQTVEVNASAVTLNTSNASMASVVRGRVVPNRYMSPSAKSKGATLSQDAIDGLPLDGRSYEQIANESFTANAQSNAFDDFFAYNLSEPVTIRKNESALVPILNAKVNAERVTLVHSNGGGLAQPLRALWLTNSSGSTLDSGSFSIVENGNFGGEGLLDPIHPNEKRLLSYAADQAVHVSEESRMTSNKLTRISIANGVIAIHRAERSSETYVVRNGAADPRTVVLEYPVQDGYMLDKETAKPDETTAAVYRFRVQVAPGETVKLPVVANHPGLTTYQLTNVDDNQFAFILRMTNDDAKLKAAVQPILEAKRAESKAEDAVEQTKTRLDNLHSNEDRQRANIAALQMADKTARDRFVHDLNATEDEIVATQKELDARTAAQEAAEAELTKRIESLEMDETL